MLLAGWLGIANASAGVWVRDLGDGYGQVGWSTNWADHWYSPSGEALPMAGPVVLGDLAPLFDEVRFVGHELAAYGEVGVGRGFEVFGSLPVRGVATHWTWAGDVQPPFALTGVGLGDAVAGTRFGQVGARGAWSTVASLRVPLYDNSPVALGMEAGNSDLLDDRVPLGQGTIEIDVGVAGGLSLGRAGWMLSEVGLRLRDRGYAPQLPARAQVGLTPAPWAGVTLDVDGLATVGTGDQPTELRDIYGKGPLFVDGAARLGVFGGVFLKPFTGRDDRWRTAGLRIGGGGLVAGAATAASAGVSASIFWEGKWFDPS